ncbi:MAG: wax ester/triacylglycerol synthase family O-acyltransferase [Solirubrobacteraceae bacterium]
MSEWLSSADAAWLHMDRPSNLMVINSVLLFEKPVDWERIQAIMQERLVKQYPKFRKRVVESTLRLLPARWADDPDFAIGHHMHHFALPAPGDDRALRELVGDLMTMPLDRNRPMWHMYLVDGYGDGCALIVRIHHCIADGVTLAETMLSLTDGAPGTQVATLEPEEQGHGGLIGVGAGIRVLSSAGSSATTLVRQGTNLAVSPSRTAGLARAVVRDGTTAFRLLTMSSDAPSSLKGDPGISRLVTWTSPISLTDVRRAARAHDGTVNDVLLGAVAGALRHWLEARGEPLADVQAMVPFNLRALDQKVHRDLGNHFGLVFLPLPVATSGADARVREVRTRMEEIKRSRDGQVTYGLISVAGRTPEPVERLVVDMFTAKVTAVMTNVPGPKEPVYVAGAPISAALVWAPTSGHIGMSVSIFSYRNEVIIGLMVDATLIPDPELIIAQIETEVSALLQPAPSVNKTEPSVNKPEPSVKRPQPSVNRPEPSVNRPQPSFKKPEPSVR